ncbi:hypothetical protein JXO52_05310 [bacterium]|nr:hypothetical protein [bacterium]
MVEYIDTLSLKEELKTYASPRSKLTTMIQSGEIVQVRRGLYLRGGISGYSVKTLANKIYGPSYLSFEYALSVYGLIPERVENPTSAVFRKNKRKVFRTPAGMFTYQPVPESVYYKAIRRSEEEGGSFLIASPEKAVLDTLYMHRSIQSGRRMLQLLEEDLRIDMDGLHALDPNVVVELAPCYGKRITLVFADWLKKELTNA